MAIDTQDKRRSAGSHLCLTVYPTPAGSVADADRQHCAWLYRGIAATVTTYVSTTARRFRVFTERRLRQYIERSQVP